LFLLAICLFLGALLTAALAATKIRFGATYPPFEFGDPPMMRRLGLTLAILLVAAVVNTLSAAPPEGDGWVALFNGKNLDGWEQRNGTATYKVEDGCVVGTTSEGSPNSFMCTKKTYGDFELVFEVKVDDELNSGVQFRSRTKDDKPSERVHGPQVEIATNGSAGCVYGEGTSFGWLSGPTDDATKTGAFKKGQWNKYRVLAKGKHIQTWVNGIPIVDFEEDKTNMPDGFIGLQVHGIGKGAGPYSVRWKEIYLRELK
jgi:hypothetical protein